MRVAPILPTASLLRRPTDRPPPGCFCQPGRCMAPRPHPCRDPAKRDAEPKKD